MISSFRAWRYWSPSLPGARGSWSRRCSFNKPGAMGRHSSVQAVAWHSSGHWVGFQMLRQGSAEPFLSFMQEGRVSVEEPTGSLNPGRQADLRVDSGSCLLVPDFRNCRTAGLTGGDGSPDLWSFVDESFNLWVPDGPGGEGVGVVGECGGARQRGITKIHVQIDVFAYSVLKQ